MWTIQIPQNSEITPILITNTNLQTNIIERIIISAMIPGTPSMSAHLRSSPLHDRVPLSNRSDYVM